MDEARNIRQVSVYVSYARADTVRLERFVPVLRSVGCRVWMDEGKVHTNYQELARQLQDDIRVCDVMVVALSPAAVDSRWVQRETKLAQRLGKPIIPVMVRAIQPPNTQGMLETIDLYDIERLEEGTTKLIAALNQVARQGGSTGKNDGADARPKHPSAPPLILIPG